MSALSERCAAYRAMVTAPRIDLRELSRLAAEAAGAMPGDEDEMRREATAILAHLAHPDPFVAAQTALLVGCFAEQGLAAVGLAGPILERCRHELELAQPYHAWLVEESQRLEDAGELEGDDAPPDDALLFGGDYTVTHTLAKAAAERMPRAADAYFAMDMLWRPVVAVLTRDAASRAEARSDERLKAAVEALSLDVVGWVHKLLQGADDEEWIVLHPGEGKGFVVRVRDMVDNWSLQPLLADALVTEKQGGVLGIGAKAVGPPNGLSGRRPPPELVRCIRGEGPQELRGGVEGQWDTYIFRAIGADGTLTPSLLEHKIWNEGIPVDIPALDGHRVVVLGPPLVSRTWNANRAFEAMGSDLELVRALDATELREWLERCANAGD